VLPGARQLRLRGRAVHVGARRAAGGRRAAPDPAAPSGLTVSVRLTGGSLKGRVVDVPDRPGVRPTAGRAREALFSMLGQRLDGCSVLDLFGGSGLLTFEAVSRGAGPARVVERDPRVAAHIRRSAAALGVEVEVLRADAARLTEGTWDLVLLDPPYADPPERWLRHAGPRCRGRLVLEHRAGAALPEGVDGAEGPLRLQGLRRYGASALAIYAGPGALPGGAEGDEVAEDLGVVEGEGLAAQVVAGGEGGLDLREGHGEHGLGVVRGGR